MGQGSASLRQSYSPQQGCEHADTLAQDVERELLAIIDEAAA